MILCPIYYVDANFLSNNLLCSLIPDQHFCVCPEATLKIRVWTCWLEILGPNYKVYGMSSHQPDRSGKANYVDGHHR